jgi:hypothetical protein
MRCGFQCRSIRLAKLDPKRKRDPQTVLYEIHDHIKLFMVYHRLTGSGAVGVGSGETEKYLDVM